MADHQTCEERVEKHMEGCVEVLRDLWELCREGSDEYHPEHETNLYEYGLCFDHVEPYTFTDQPEGYWRYQISWGGPSEEFRFYDRGHNGTYVEYWFMDWFDGAKRILHGEDRTLLLEIFDWLRGV